MKYKTASDGDWIKLRLRQRIRCCDCGLIHDVTIQVKKDGYFYVQPVRNNRATAATRRGGKFVMVKKEDKANAKD